MLEKRNNGIQLSHQKKKLINDSFKKNLFTYRTLQT
jgi:hypothetical protein